MHHFLKSSLNDAMIIVSVFCFGFLAMSHVDSSSRSVIKPPSPALEGEVLTTGLPGKSPVPCILFNHSFFQLHEGDTVIITFLLQMRKERHRSTEQFPRIIELENSTARTQMQRSESLKHLTV